ncbi:MAG: LytR C-terminal domain-containing protein, partial [Candidatus Marinimicrobia bacterium]|nr:LytR C-terminal domain-containing protein [Candidatus Neomarinimicrobiota bacterium]
MKYFLDSIIIILSFIIIIFGWSVSKTFLDQNILLNMPSSKIESMPKIKLFENYDNQTLKVAILNGCGISGLGNQFSDLLNSKYGLVIVRTENADNFDYEMTKVVIINDSNPNIENLLTILGMTINNENVEFNSSYNPQEDI